MLWIEEEKPYLCGLCKVVNEEIIRPLIQKGIDINKQDHEGQTALMWAVKSGHIDIVGYLLKHPELDMKIMDNQKRTVFMRVIQSGTPDMIDFFLTKKKKFKNLQQA